MARATPCIAKLLVTVLARQDGRGLRAGTQGGVVLTVCLGAEQLVALPARPVDGGIWRLRAGADALMALATPCIAKLLVTVLARQVDRGLRARTPGEVACTVCLGAEQLVALPARPVGGGR